MYKNEFHQLLLYEDQYMRIIMLAFKPDESGIKSAVEIGPSTLAQLVPHVLHSTHESMTPMDITHIRVII